MLTTRMKSRGRGHGDRPHLRGGAGQGHALAGERAARAWAPTADADCFDDDPLRRPGSPPPPQERIFYMAEALRRGVGRTRRCTRLTGHRPLVHRAHARHRGPSRSTCAGLKRLTGSDQRRTFRLAKRDGPVRRADRPTSPGPTSMTVRARRKELGVVPAFKTVDTCAAEFQAGTTLPLQDL